MFDKYCVSVVCRKLTIKSNTEVNFLMVEWVMSFSVKILHQLQLKLQTWKIIFVFIRKNMVTVQTVSV